jgi:5'-AMP-activated protein kinase regulatory beta subunit
VLKWSGYPGKNITVCGNWDGWQARIPLVRSREDFSTIINLPEGMHEFKFCVDGEWRCDGVLDKAVNATGQEHNVITVNQKDFQVFDALDKDQAETVLAGAAAASEKAAAAGSAVAGRFASGVKPTEDFTQTAPDRRAYEACAAPPSLPPQLLQVVLNKDTPQCHDPNILPEPHHVMINHLYALSIKDGVMVLSSSFRYRKKYITTLLYKPIAS